MKLKNFLKLFVLALVCVLTLASCGEKPAHILYAAPDGDPEGEGTSSDPLDFTVALATAKPGMTILMEGGEYKYNSRLQISRSGSPNKYITVMPKNDKEVIFDFSEMQFLSSNRGIQLYGDFWHFKEITIRGAGDNGMYISGSYNIIENCLFYNNRDTGLQLGRGASADTSINVWPSYNLIKNCTSFANYDDETFGENADGFAAKLTSGYGNVFDGCVAFRNSDDGWDLYAKEDSGNIGTVILYNCVSFENGYLPYLIDRVDDITGETYQSYNTMNGDGIGFKLGGSVMEGDVLLNNCVAFNNKLHGFGDNSNPGVIDIRNCTAFNNCIGLDGEGNVSGRGVDGGKSNNIDLARGTSGVSKSYNNYYGVLSYVNNQSDYVADTGEEDDAEKTYNTDKFRGSASYSIFNSQYDQNNKKEIYKAFTTTEDASAYASKTVDVTFSLGTEFTGLNDSCFASLDPINAKCASVEKLTDLYEYHETLRNEDGSVNLGDLLKVVDENLLTYCNGSQIGANLSKGSHDEYSHYLNLDFSECTTPDEVRVASAYAVTEVLCYQDAVYQDFEVPKLIDGCDISWTSSNEDILSVQKEEKISVSDAVFGEIKLYTPQKDTEVTLTATITKGSVTKTKEFKLLVKSRAQALGGITLDASSSVKADKFGGVSLPRVYALDKSAIGTRELPLSLYDMEYTYKYATSKAETFYNVDGIETAVPGVYQVVATATSKIEGDVMDNRGNQTTASLTYYVYILDKECIIDFMPETDPEVPTNSITLTSEGYAVNGFLTNLYGDVYSVYSPEQLVSISANDLVTQEKINGIEVQHKNVEHDSISLEFNAGSYAGNEFYGYYVVANKAKTYVSEVYSFKTTIVEVSTKQQFNELARTGKISGISANSTTIYKLTNDFDYSDGSWSTSYAKGTFSGMINGNGHTIKNISVESTDKDGLTNVFYKVQNGSIINTNFENINLNNKNSTDGKIVGIIGRLQGAYLHNIKMKNISAHGSERVGALVGQCIGGYNFLTRCQLENDENQVLSSTKKYTSGLIGEAEVESSNPDKTISITIELCSVVANIGDGKDSGGCHGGMIGRVKADYDTTYITITNCYYRGTITTTGNYNAGMIGDISNGNAKVSINSCYSDIVFVYKGTLLDIKDITTMDDVQAYAHKNCNPICGRANYTKNVGEYKCDNNLGTWSEYYDDQIKSTSIMFDMSYVDEETNELHRWTVTSDFLNNIGFDLENVWTFEDGKLSLR